jgi:Alginate export
MNPIHQSLVTALLLATATSGIATAGPVETPTALPNDFPKSLKFDVELRVRGEWTDNVRDFNNDLHAADDDGWLITRSRLGVAWQPSDWLKLYVQGQDSMEALSGRPHDTSSGANGNDHFDLRQAYLAFGDPKASPVSFTLGRQPLDFGSRRVVADSGWSNYGRTFDAARLTWRASKDWTVDAFAGNVVTVREDEFNTPDRASDLAGLWATGKLPGEQILDLYILHLDSEDSKIAPVRGDFWTIGSRLFKKPSKASPWDYELEAVAQTGHVFAKKKELELLAFGSQSTLGYTFFDAPWSPRVSANFNYASGDHRMADGDQDRLQPLYPSTHAMNGLLDSIGWANLLDPYVEVKIAPVENWTISLQAHAFFRAETSDFAYRANGSTPVRTPAGASDDRYIGTEFDLTLQTSLTQELELLVGGGVLLAGDYLASTGAADNAGTLYAQLTYKY